MSAAIGLKIHYLNGPVISVIHIPQAPVRQGRTPSGPNRPAAVSATESWKHRAGTGCSGCGISCRTIDLGERPGQGPQPVWPVRRWIAVRVRERRLPKADGTGLDHCAGQIEEDTTTRPTAGRNVVGGEFSPPPLRSRLMDGAVRGDEEEFPQLGNPRTPRRSNCHISHQPHAIIDVRRQPERPDCIKLSVLRDSLAEAGAHRDFRRHTEGHAFLINGVDDDGRTQLEGTVWGSRVTQGNELWRIENLRRRWYGRRGPTDQQRSYDDGTDPQPLHVRRSSAPARHG
jgi:hypothetical protein